MFRPQITLSILLTCLVIIPFGASAQEDDTNCPSLPARLVVGEMGQSIRDGEGATNVRPNPGVGEPVTEIQEGESFQVIGEAVCGITRNGDRMRFFQIETNSGQQGWIPEASDMRYFLEPSSIQPEPQQYSFEVSEGGQIVFTNKIGEVWLINLDSSSPHKIIVELPIHPNYSPPCTRNSFLPSSDGKYIGFANYDPTQGKSSVTIVDTSSEVIALDIPDAGYGFDWSPDERQIVHVVTEGNETGMQLVDVQTGREYPLLAAEASPGYPSWSPDGRHIGFHTSLNETLGQFGIVDMSTSDYFVWRDRTVGHFDWSPDGSRIVYDTVGYHVDWGKLYTANADAEGSNTQLLVNDNRFAAISPIWSPDGRHIAFVGALGEYQGGSIWLVEPDGSNLRQITSFQVNQLTPIVWSPDGRYLAATDQNGILKVVAIDTDITFTLGQVQCVSWLPHTEISSQTYLRIVEPAGVSVRSERRINNANIIGTAENESYVEAIGTPIDGWYPVMFDKQEGWMYRGSNSIFEVNVVKNCRMIEDLESVCPEDRTLILNGSKFVIYELERVRREFDAADCFPGKLLVLDRNTRPENSIGETIRKSMQNTFGESVHLIIDLQSHLAPGNDRDTHSVRGKTSIDASGIANIVFGYYLERTRQECGKVVQIIANKTFENWIANLDQLIRSLDNLRKGVDTDFSVIDLPDDQTQRATGFALALETGELTPELLADVASWTNLK